MLHGGETWAPKVEDLQRLRRNDRAMIRMMCRVRLGDEIRSNALLARLGLEDISSSLGTRRLRWYGHVSRSDPESGIQVTFNFKPAGSRSVGRPRTAWNDCVKKDICKRGLSDTDPNDRAAWRCGVYGRLLSSPVSG